MYLNAPARTKQKWGLGAYAIVGGRKVLLRSGALHGLGDTCPDYSSYAPPGCRIVLNPSYDASGNLVGKLCQARAWCTSSDASSKMYATPAPASTDGWDIHMLDQSVAAQAASDAAAQVSYGMQVLPQTAAVLQITGQPIPTPPPPPAPVTVATTPSPVTTTTTVTPAGAPTTPGSGLVSTAENFLTGSLFFGLPNWLLFGGGLVALTLLRKR